MFNLYARSLTTEKKQEQQRYEDKKARSVWNSEKEE